jgi:serine/tyrosine/threonine adenylyltransferase
VLAANRIDHTRFWRQLGDFSEAEGEVNAPIRDHFVDQAAWLAWGERYATRLRAEHSDPAARKERMNRVNPLYILRNYMAQDAIRKAEAEADYSEIERLRLLLRDPFTEQQGMERYTAPPPDWGRGIVLSCSS